MVKSNLTHGPATNLAHMSDRKLIQALYSTVFGFTVDIDSITIHMRTSVCTECSGNGKKKG